MASLRKILNYNAPADFRNWLKTEVQSPARVVVDEAEQIARREDKALNAGRAVRRALNKLQGRST